MSSLLNLKNAHFLFGGLTTGGIRLLDEAVSLWDKDTGFPSELVRHNMHVGTPYSKKGCSAGIESRHEPGYGSRFKLTRMVKGAIPWFQFILATLPGEPIRRVESPMRYALKGMPDLTRGYTVYLHAIENHDSSINAYYGVTSRHWTHRLKEHEAEAVGGSHLLFHRALMQKIHCAKMYCTTIIAAGKTKDEAYDIEEYLVDKYSLYPRHVNGLNMIPGGYEGIRWLGRMKVPLRTDAEPEERDAAIAQVFSRSSGSGQPNPAISMMWENDDYAEAVICGRENRLSAHQVRYIRMLAAEGYTVSHIMKTICAQSVEQIRRVLSGRTYGRIRS